MSERLGHRGVRRGSPRGVVGRWLVLTLASLLVLTVAATSATAFPTKLSANGQLDFNYGSAVQSAGGPSTGYKPESKLFYTGDGSTEAVRWWAVLGTSGPSPSAGVYLWELVNHTWVARVVLPGADPWAKADTLFDGSTLYVSTRDDKGSVSGNPRESDLYEVSYLGGGGWGSISGPFPITTGGPETLTIAKDSAGRIWTTFESGLNIKVGYTAPGGTSFTFITVSKTSVNSDDISEVTAFGGNKIGVFWSDQVAKRDFFAWRSDSDPITSNWTIETAYGGGVGGCPTANSDLCADDHLNVKVYNGEVYVAIKTSLNNVSGGPNDPLIALLKRTSGGTWSAFPVSTVSQNATRPITVLSPGQNAIWVWAARGGEIDVWESSFTSPGFSSGAFQTWVKGGGSADDPTGTKQVTSAATGTVVEASIKGSNQYWHNEFLPTSAPPVPTITGFSPTSGPVGTSVTITGSGFTGTSDVRFNGTSVGSGNYTVNSDTQVTAKVPSGATNGPISLDAPGGTATSSTSFTVTSPPVPTITGFSPTSGPVGTSVTITGSGFTGTSDVRFNGTSVGSGNYTVNSDTQVTAKVPSGATNGPISLDAPGGTATSSTSFTVTAPSAISEVQRKHASANDVSISATLDSAPTPGDVLAVVIVVSQASSPVFVTPPGWTAPFSPARGAVFWKVSNGTEQTLTVNLGAGETSKVLRMWIVELGGADTTNPFDQHGSGIFTSAVTTVTPTTDGATNQASGWAIAVVGHNGDNGGGASATNGFAVLGGGSSRDIGASKTLTALGTISTTISWTTARTGCWIIATFRGAGG
jgi:hypothetical protein